VSTNISSIIDNGTRTKVARFESEDRMAQKVWASDKTTPLFDSGTYPDGIGTHIVDNLDAKVSLASADLLDSLLSGHFTADSVGEALQLIRGMVQQNYMLDQTTFNASGLMTSGRIRIFSTKSEVDSANDGVSGEGEIATFAVSALAETSDSSKVKTYKVTRES
jgi:hypothetical protein